MVGLFLTNMHFHSAFIIYDLIIYCIFFNHSIKRGQKEKNRNKQIANTWLIAAIGIHNVMLQSDTLHTTNPKEKKRKERDRNIVPCLKLGNYNIIKKQETKCSYMDNDIYLNTSATNRTTLVHWISSSSSSNTIVSVTITWTISAIVQSCMGQQ